MLLARSEDSPQRFYSMSTQIRQERKEYYEILEATQKGTLDITRWMAWFLGCLGSAIEGAQTTLAAVLAKARFWEGIAGTTINERQRMILNRLLDGFDGKLTTSKYAKLAKSSNDTALRDILFLVEHGILVRSPERGRLGDLGRGAVIRERDRDRALRRPRSAPDMREALPQKWRRPGADQVPARPRLDPDDGAVSRLRAGDRRRGERWARLLRRCRSVRQF
jgi:hypothetical protein